jgi:hypothetical protein
MKKKIIEICYVSSSLKVFNFKLKKKERSLNDLGINTTLPIDMTFNKFLQVPPM